MCLYLRTKFQVSSIILTIFFWVILTSPFTTKGTPKKLTQIIVNCLNKVKRKAPKTSKVITVKVHITKPISLLINKYGPLLKHLPRS